MRALLRTKLARTAGLTLAVGLAAHLSLLSVEAGVASIWFSNAFVLAALLRTRRSGGWVRALAAGWIGCAAATTLSGGDPGFAVASATLNQIEVAICAAMCRIGGGAGRFKLAHGRHLIAFGTGVLLAPLITAAAAAAMLSPGLGSAPTVLQRWWFADSLGLLVTTPALLALYGQGLRRLGRELRSRRAVVTWLATLATFAAVFAQSERPVPFLIYPALVLCAFQLSSAGAALAVLVTAVVAVVSKLYGLGPIAMVNASLAGKVVVAQLFLANAALITLAVSAVVTERRRTLERLTFSEARYRELAQTIPDLILRVRRGRITYASPGAERYGYRPGDLVGRELVEFIHPEDIWGAMDRMTSHSAVGFESDFPREQRVRTAEGDWVWLEGNPRPLLGPEGEVIEIVNVFRDVTQRKVLEEQLAGARDEAERAARVKADFMANMSHEIRTPLTAILGFTSLLEGQPRMTSEARGQVARIASAGRALLSIVNDILDFSKLEAGRMPMSPRPASLRQTVEEAVAMFDPQAAAKGLSLTLEGAEALPDASIDPDRVRQVLLNLVGNAVKFTDEGAVTVRASYDVRTETLGVEVTDTGSGMDEAQQARLFQRFSQVDADQSARGAGGTGLGLAICRGLVEAMGGVIGVTSEPGRGSTFHFRVPAPRTQLAADAETADMVTLEGLSVLVADDNAVNRELVRALLTPLGADVTDAADGFQAVDEAMARPFDLVLMDLRMPGRDGPEAARMIRAKDGPNRGAAILAFTADYDLARYGPGAEAVFDGVVRKPVELSELVLAIANLASAERAAPDPHGLVGASAAT